MIYINQKGHTSLGWGETKEKAFQDATSIFSDLIWEEIKDYAKIVGECYWSEVPEEEA